ncbi:MAG: VacJ family lipoprotein [Candidatus Azosocius agrarius]|nr:MAG: VacJ family lipoprotein [Gammaproteobacteria bacterium]
MYFKFFKIGIFLILFFFMSINCNAYKLYEDPLEILNKKSYFINKLFDKFFLKPIVISYLKIMPNFIVEYVNNVVENYNDISNIIHNILQSNIKNFYINFIRYSINSFCVFFGIFDISKKFNFFFNKEHYGKTLKYLGYNKSSYLVLPILGSCTVRDILGLLINNNIVVNKFYLDKYIKYYYIFYILYERIFLLSSEKIFIESSVNEYVLYKNIYLQYIKYQYNKSV